MNFKKFAVVLLAIMMVFSLSACGKKAMVSINDGGVVTEVEVTLPSTVSKILEAAEIQINDGDVVEPSLDTKLSDAEEIKVSRLHKVELTLAGTKKSVEIVGGTVADLLKQEGITLSDKQKINHDLTAPITDGMEIKIAELLSVTAKYDGKTETKSVEATKVGDALKELGITLGSDDRVKPEADKEITDGMEIVVDRVKIENVTQKVDIEYEVEYIYDEGMTSGAEETRTSGENGQKEVTFKITTVNGEEESREIVEEKVLKEPVNAVVAIGTYEPPAETPSYSGGSSDGGSSSAGTDTSGGVYEVSRKRFDNCSGDGHGYYEILYSDGHTEYVEF